MKYHVCHYSNPLDNKAEAEANYFASHFLIPTDRLRQVLSITDNLQIIADYFGVSRGVIENRLYYEK